MALEYQVKYNTYEQSTQEQGQQHYRNVKQFSKSNVDEDKLRDLQKGILCKEKGIFHLLFCELKNIRNYIG